jgi:hypothetical protein
VEEKKEAKEVLDFEEVMEEELEEVLDYPPQMEQGFAIQLSIGVLGTIKENLGRTEVVILDEVNNAMAKAKGGDTAQAKKVVSYANNQIKDLNQKRIAVKKEWMKPIDAIAERIKEIEKKVNAAVDPLSKEIEIQEKKELDAKVLLVKQLKDERIDKEIPAISKFINKCEWFDSSTWLNKSTSKVKITREIDAKVTEIVGNLKALDLIGDGNRNSAAVSLKYQENGNLSEAITYRNQLEEADKQEEERKAKAEAEKQERLAREEEEKAAREERIAIQKEAEAERIRDEIDQEAMGIKIPLNKVHSAPIKGKIENNDFPNYSDKTTTQSENVHDYTLTIRCRKMLLPILGNFLREKDCKFKLEAK